MGRESNERNMRCLFVRPQRAQVLIKSIYLYWAARWNEWKGIWVALIELIPMCNTQPFGSVSVSGVRSTLTAIHSRPSALRASARRQSDKALKKERARERGRTPELQSRPQQQQFISNSSTVLVLV
jgi:hypothetical protein